ncbi:cytochrome-c peroxidase [Noviherbaspirillum denitrificans]|nr:cytochrome c peroxidase [Noviherbaspirillum denitrificans]
MWSCSAVFPAAAQSRPLDEPIRPLPDKLDVDPVRVALGKRLFFDTRFSRDGKVSCANCHDFGKGGADGRERSPGVDGRLGPANSPSVFNAVFNFRQLWNGKAQTLQDQVDMAIASPNVFDTNWDSILARLGRDAVLARAFRQAYPDGLTRRNVTDALVAFERTLVTPSRFDAWLRGNADAISAEEKQGYAKFKSYGCVACHQGINVGGNMFQVFGVVRPYLGRDGVEKESDLGRFLVTRRESDKHVFKVPSLRNVALTAPYFHDASARTLEEAVDVMIKYQLGRTAPKEDRALIVKFLHTLTGAPPPGAQPEPGQ